MFGAGLGTWRYSAGANMCLVASVFRCYAFWAAAVRYATFLFLSSRLTFVLVAVMCNAGHPPVDTLVGCIAGTGERLLPTEDACGTAIIWRGFAGATMLTGFSASIAGDGRHGGDVVVSFATTTPARNIRRHLAHYAPLRAHCLSRSCFRIPRVRSHLTHIAAAAERYQGESGACVSSVIWT
jgi:hypothetical protein